jgi:hypothetical protein
MSQKCRFRPRLDFRAKSAEKCRVCSPQPADFAQVSVRQGTGVIPADIAHNSLSKTASLTVFFSENFHVFHGTGTEPQSMTCELDIGVAREKHRVSTGTLGTEIKPTPTGGE